MVLHAHDDRAVKSGVGLAVTAAVESVARGEPGGGRNCGDAAEPGPGRLGADPVDVVPGDDEQFGGGVRADAEGRDDVVVGVDTHKDEHVAVVLDGLGGRLAEQFLPATAEGFTHLLAVSSAHVGPQGRLIAFGVEGTGSYGIGLAHFLRRQGHQVHEVNRPPRKGERRLTGKSDLLDAEHAARQVLSGGEPATPKTADGDVESLRLLKIARDTAVKARTAAMIALKATLVTAADELRAQLKPLTDHKLIHACAALDSAGDLSTPDAAMRHVLSSLARRWLQLHEEITAHSRHLKTLTRTAAPQLLELVGVGFDIAAEMLVTASGPTEHGGGDRV